MTNNSSHPDIWLDEGFVTSLAVPFWTQPGFAIPLVQSRSKSNISYVQRVDRNRRIIGFEPFEGKSHVVAVEHPEQVRLGEREFFALIDPAGDAHAGSQDKLAPIVRKWVAQIDTPLVRMSFARFCGNDALAVSSAADAVRSKSAEFKSENKGILWFIDAVVMVDLVNALAGLATSRGRKVEEDFFEKSLVSVRLSEDRLSIELPAFLLSQAAVAKTNARIENLLQFTQQAIGRDLFLTEGDESKQKRLSRREPEEQLREITLGIQRLSTQEWRLARLIRNLLVNPRKGEALLHHYSDRTVFMQKCLYMLRDALRPWPKGKRLEERLAALLPKIITGSYPRQKGRLLLQLARELNEFGSISEVIRKIALTSRAQEVALLRDSIMELLKSGFQGRR